MQSDPTITIAALRPRIDGVVDLVDLVVFVEGPDVTDGYGNELTTLSGPGPIMGWGTMLDCAQSIEVTNGCWNVYTSPQEWAKVSR